MTEREVFLKAIEITDKREREAFIAAACQGDSRLLSHITKLLETDSQSGEFLEVPAWEHMAFTLGGNKLKDLLLKRFRDSDAEQPEEVEPDNLDLTFLRPSTNPECLGMLGTYQVESVIGSGGFGTVLKVFDTQLHRHVAIKVMKNFFADSSPPRKRFLREARSGALVTHENVVRIYSVEEQPLPFLVMELIEGQNLRQKLRENGPFSIHELMHIAVQIAQGIRAAHEYGLIHRDIKPANVLIQRGPQQQVKLSDFGLARTKDDASLSQSGFVSGTPLYMSPEQILGVSIDHRTDLFSFGSVLYEMACGHPPFRAPGTIPVMHRVVQDRPRSLRELDPDIPKWLEDIIFKLLEKNPEDRFASMDQVCEILSFCKESLETGKEIEHPLLSRISTDFSVTSQDAADSSRLSLPKWWMIWSVSAAMLLIAFASAIYRWPKNALDESPQTITSDAKQALGKAEPAESSTKALSEIQIDGRKHQLPSILEEAGFPDDLYVKAPFNNLRAKQIQHAWAKHLDIPVEITAPYGIEMVLVPGGDFLMGLELSDRDVFLNNPNYPYTDQKNLARNSAVQHWVRISRPFYISKYEISEMQLAEVLADGPVYEVALDLENENIPERGRSAEIPATRLSWREAVAFCNQLSAQEGLPTDEEGLARRGLYSMGYRLPTEAEWEWTARSGDRGVLSPAETSKSIGWFRENSGGTVHPLGKLSPNAFGVHDMFGNVQEWCADFYNADAYLQRAKTDAITYDPIQRDPSPRDGMERVQRGGSVIFGTYLSSPAMRNSRPPESGSWFTGFRIVKTIQVSKPQ
jgi:serine/threonine protein kinase